MSKKKIRDRKFKNSRKRRIKRYSEIRKSKNSEEVERVLKLFDRQETLIHQKIEESKRKNREFVRKDFFKSGLLLHPDTGLIASRIRITDMSATGYGFWSRHKIKRSDYILVYNVNHKPVRVQVKIHWREKLDLVYSYGCEMIL